jgi:hypothetical protein
MKAKDYIIIGGAVALFLLWKNKQKTKGSTSNTTTKGGNITPRPLGLPPEGFVGGTIFSTTGTSQVNTLPTPTSTEPEQVFGLGLPTGMDLPILTAGTGIPTEVAVQQGGVSTTPTPAIIHAPPLGIEESLGLGGIKPINKPTIGLASAPTLVLSDESPIVVMPYVKPTLYSAV